MNQPVFDATQRAWLLTQMSEQQLSGIEVVAQAGSLASVEALLTGTKLSAADKALVVEHAKGYIAANGKPAAAAKPSGFPTSAPQAAAFTPAAPLGTVVSGVSIAEQVAALLTVTKQDGTVIRKGLAKTYRDNPNAWPTSDPFGRPFPSLTAILALPKVQAKDFFTSSGFPRVKLDGIRYYVQDKVGKSLTLIAQMQQQQHHLQQAEDAAAKAQNRAPSPIVIDPATVPDDIGAGQWRWWNEVRGEGARYDVPARHVELCKMKGILPIEFEALASKPATTAAPAAKPRGRKARA